MPIVTTSGTSFGDYWTKRGNEWLIRGTGNTIYPIQDQTWRTWTSTSINYEVTYAYTQNQVWNTWQERDEALLADVAQAERERRSRQELAASYREQRIQAHDRGMELLEMILTDEEKLLRSQQDRDVLVVRGSEGGLYHIYLDYCGGSVHGNVMQVCEEGCQIGRVCIAPNMYGEGGSLPISDGYVGQYLAIKHQEELFRRIGNWSQRRQCRHSEQPVAQVPVILAA